jgi:hypothetical protein
LNNVINTSNNIINFYSKIDKKDTQQGQLPKTWANHHIYNNSMIMCLGNKGAGKTNALFKSFWIIL